MRVKMFSRQGFLLLSALCCLPVGTVRAQTAADSGWVDLINKSATTNQTAFANLYTYFVGPGYTATSVDTQHVFNVEYGGTDSAMIHVIPPTPAGVNAYIATIKQYKWYRARVDWRWPTTAVATANGGMFILIDNQAAFSRTVTSANRPRSIEINTRRDGAFPWTMWSAASLGPYITSTVTALPKLDSAGYYKTGGPVTWTDDPWNGSNGRVIASSYPDPELPLGQWNHGEADVYGDSAVLFMNNQLRTSGWHFQLRNPANANDSATAHRVRIDSGGVAVQYEGFETWYRNWQIQLLDSATGQPVALMNWQRNQRLSGKQLVVNTSGADRWIDIPAGYSGVQLYNLRGQLVWSQRGASTRAMIPTGVEKGILRARFLP